MTDAKPNHRSITIRMGAYLLCALDQKGYGMTADRTTKALRKRGLLVEAPEADRTYRVTQAGREVLNHHLNFNGQANGATVQQPNVITSCGFWSDFYGLHADVRYSDDPDTAVRFDWAESFHSAYEALNYILRDLTKRRGLLLACSPEPILSPDL